VPNFRSAPALTPQTSDRHSNSPAQRSVQARAKKAISKKAVAVYRELQELQDGLSKSLRGVFAKHRKLVLK
jgi:hypothetical protein